MESKGEGSLASIPSDDHSSADHVPSNLNEETTTNKKKDDFLATQEKLKGDEDKDEDEDGPSPDESDEDQKFSIMDHHSLAEEKDDINQVFEEILSQCMDLARSHPYDQTTVEGQSYQIPSFNHGEASSYSWLSELKEEELLLVRVKTLQSNDDAEKDEKIPKQEAVCRFCFNIFENDNVLKTKCKCKFTLIHQECATEWSRKGNNRCNVCDQDIQNIPVFLLKYFEASRSEPRPSSQKVRRRLLRF